MVRGGYGALDFVQTMRFYITVAGVEGWAVYVYLGGLRTAAPC